MAFIHTTTPQDADGELAAMYARQQTAWGYVPNYAKAFSHRPEVMARWGRLLAEIKRPMDARRFELVTFVASLELRSSACALVHGKKLRAFFSDEDILAIAVQRPCDSLTEAERAMLRFARQLIRDATQITAQQVDGLKALGFSDGEVFDIAATAAGRAFFAKLLDALGALPDLPLLALDAALREALTVGRPIDSSPCETMPMPAPAV
jgi:uncharacterized peroxidase-related enzyme